MLWDGVPLLRWLGTKGLVPAFLGLFLSGCSGQFSYLHKTDRNTHQQMRNKKTGQALKRAGPKPQCSSHMITWGKHENTGEAEIAIFFLS
jgi:hypothetical protein